MSGLNNNRNWQQTGIPAFRLPRYEENPMKRKATPAQLAARERFAEMARSGAFKRKAKKNPAKKTVSQKISQLTREGYPQKQAVAIALSEERKGKVKRNPIKQFIVFTETKPGTWKQVKVTENLAIAKELADNNAASGYASVVEDSSGAIVYTPELKSNPAEAKERKPRVVLITNPKQRMGLIAFRTAGGALTTKEVPILFSFKLPVAANLYGEKSMMDFFAHKDGQEIAVTEKTTGFKLGNIPRVFMAVGRDEKAAAKYFVEDLLKKHGAAKLRAAVESKPKIA